MLEALAVHIHEVICIFHSQNELCSLHHTTHLFNIMQTGRFPSVALEKSNYGK